MKKILVFILLICFFYNNHEVIISMTNGLNIWSKNLFPILFPTFILSDLMISSNIVKYLNKVPLNKVFKSSKYTNYILLISILSGTPTNAKNLSVLLKNNLIDKKELNKLLNLTLFFNPIFVLKMTNLKVLITLYVSNLITAFIYRNQNKSSNNNYKDLNIKFNLNESINTNMNILISILGTVCLFNVLANILPINNILIKTILASILEVTNGLIKINNLIISKDIFYLFTLTFGSISIFIQLKSILKDALDKNFYIKSRITTFLVSLIVFNLI